MGDPVAEGDCVTELVGETDVEDDCAAVVLTVSVREGVWDDARVADGLTVSVRLPVGVAELVPPTVIEPL